MRGHVGGGDKGGVGGKEGWGHWRKRQAAAGAVEGLQGHASPCNKNFPVP